MLKIKQKEFWFIVGSQSLYGEEALKEVENHAMEMAEKLNQSGNLAYPIQFKSLATSADEITAIIKEINYQDKVAGVITWMHTFSPAKMWITGTKLLQKPLLHLVTQYNQEVPWSTIDMDFMNLNQSAHGDREYGFINARLKKNNKTVVGYWKNEDIQQEISDWMNVAIGFCYSSQLKVARFGDNMRHVAVTEGDKVEAQIQFGWTVDYYGIGDLVAVMNGVTEDEINRTYQEYQTLYDFEIGNNDPNYFEEHVKEQAKIEIGLRRFLENGGYTAFTTNFEDLHGMKQLPGLAVQRLNAEGYGFAGEGDWKTAALDRLMKVMANNEQTGFMEDYTYDLTTGAERIIGSHMLEVDPTLAANKPKIVVHPLGIGNKEDPARFIFDGAAGEGIVVSMLDLGTHYRLLVNAISTVTSENETPHLPVAKVIWEPKPNFKDGIKSWIQAGGGHHTVLSLSLSVNQIADWSKMVELETVIIQ
ncbi:L-arabinose isomerase [Peribacillus sp. B2I2]|uniref:L-arabinose isomerase n=1 Tax=Peribacillus sp. B2I2 TaxID=3156468 RepID=UPI003512E9AD